MRAITWSLRPMLPGTWCAEVMVSMFIVRLMSLMAMLWVHLVITKTEKAERSESIVDSHDHNFSGLKL